MSTAWAVNAHLGVHPKAKRLPGRRSPARTHATAKPMSPTSRMLRAVEAAYDHFNRELFGGELPPPLLNLSRPIKGQAAGFFVPDAWAHREGELRVCELSITPEGTARAMVQVYSTLVHEMAHYLEHVQGHRPKSPGYHSNVWWSIMERIGLTPAPQGKSRIRVTHTIDPDGAYLKAFEKLAPELQLPLVSAEFAPREGGGEDEEEEEKPTKQGKRAKYLCDGCSTTMRGPSGRRVICGDCEQEYVEVGF